MDEYVFTESIWKQLYKLLFSSCLGIEVQETQKKGTGEVAPYSFSMSA